MKIWISNLVRTTHVWNNLYLVRSQLIGWQNKFKSFQIRRNQGLRHSYTTVKYYQQLP